MLWSSGSWWWCIARSDLRLNRKLLRQLDIGKRPRRRTSKLASLGLLALQPAVFITHLLAPIARIQPISLPRIDADRQDSWLVAIDDRRPRGRTRRCLLLDYSLLFRTDGRTDTTSFEPNQSKPTTTASTTTCTSPRR